MTKIAFIGAGSLSFTVSLARDILTFPLLKDATLTLMDIDAEKLEFAERAVRRIVEMGNYPAEVKVTMDRVEALKDADAVMVTILAGGTDVCSMTLLFPRSMALILTSVILVVLRECFVPCVLSR